MIVVREVLPVMNVPLTRRDLREPVRRIAQKLGFADASTRKGAADQTRHIDGESDRTRNSLFETRRRRHTARYTP